jgi:hypothetical protein
LDQDKSLLPWFYTECTRSGEAALRSIESAKKLFKSYCKEALFNKSPSASRNMYIILDGLDECALSERKSVADLLVEVVKDCDDEKPGRMRILIVSQDYVDIEKALCSRPEMIVPMVIKIRAIDNEADIRQFVDAQVLKIDRKHGPLSEEVKTELKDQTTRNANGKLV